MSDKTHYRKAFNSPYLASADIVEPTELTIARVRLELDKTKKTKDEFNTAYFVEKEIRPDEILKPMILNAGNSKIMAGLAKSAFIEDWNNIRVCVYVDHAVKFGRDTVEGLRLGIGSDLISEDDAVALLQGLQKVNGDVAAFLKHFKIASLSSLPASSLARAQAMIERKRSKAA